MNFNQTNLATHSSHMHIKHSLCRITLVQLVITCYLISMPPFCLFSRSHNYSTTTQLLHLVALINITGNS